MNTKERILKASEKLFYKKGVDRTSVKDIAEESGTNIAALNYHFKSKENLVDILFGRMLSLVDPLLPNIFIENIPLEQKIRKFIDLYTDILVRFNPHLPFFIMTILQRDPKKILKLKLFEELYNPRGLFAQIEEEINKGTINKIDPQHYFITILSLIGFPFAMQNVLLSTNKWKRKDFERFVKDRTDMVYSISMSILKDSDSIHP
jgi:TetR/AcrR family transcriptional regulator